MMNADLEGLVERLTMSPRSHALQPLFEAISNSLYAIETSNREDGKIQINLTRNPAQGTLDLNKTGEDAIDRALPEITSIRIFDNGSGFNKDNFESFQNIGSRYKLQSGGKGVGRLAWLRAFASVEVISVYGAENSRRERRFKFQLPDGVVEPSDEATKGADTGTTIILSGLRSEYAPYMRQRATTIASEITRHFLAYFLTNGVPRIELFDSDGDAVTVGLDDKTKQVRSDFQVKDEQFSVHHVKIKTPAERQHAIYYCADNRVVRTERLKILPPTQLKDEGGDFYYQAYVTSSFLDSHANLQRTTFDIEEEPTFPNYVSQGDIRSSVEEKAKDFLSPVLAALRETRDARISQVLAHRLPEYSYVRKANPVELDRIPYQAGEAEIESAIATIHIRNQQSGRKLLDQTVREMDKAGDFDAKSFADRFDTRFQEVIQTNQASLLSYLLFRRSIIELFQQILRKSGSKFEKEAALHSLIFPMGKDHDTSQAYLEHNLWLIDERLTYANYIASDMSIKKHKVLFDPQGGGEPDIALYYKMGFSADDPASGQLHEVVLVEFKRPGPLAKREESPYQQILRYIDQIQDGMYDEAGQKVKASKAARFYCYIVCDVDSDEIQRLVKHDQFKPLFGGEEGYFLYNPEMNAHVELVPFEKVLRDAKRNHRSFFERMGLVALE